MDMKQTLSEHGFAGLSGQETWDSSSLEQCLAASDQFVQRCLRECYSDSIVTALCGDDIDAVRKRLIENMSGRTQELMLEDIEKASPSAEEIESARNDIVQVIEREKVTYEQELWEEYHSFLPPKALETDLAYLKSLTPEQRNVVFEEMDHSLMIIVFSSSPEWRSLFDSTNQLFSDRAVELLTDDIESEKIDYPWVPELGKRVMTHLAKLSVDDPKSFEEEKLKRIQWEEEKKNAADKAMEEKLASLYEKYGEPIEEPKGLLGKIGAWFR